MLKEVGLDVPQTTELRYALQKSGLNVKTDVLSIKETAEQIKSALEEK